MAVSYDTSTGLRALQGSSLVEEIDTGFLALAQDVAARLPTFVTALPASPYDGQEVFYQAAAGVNWHFRYRAASASAYKWEFLGGPALTDADAVTFGTSGTSYVAMTTAITLPANICGNFFARFGASVQQFTAGDGYISVGSTASNPLDSLAIITSVGNRNGSAYETPVLTTVGGDTISLRCRVSNASGALSANNRWLSVEPLSVKIP